VSDITSSTLTITNPTGPTVDIELPTFAQLTYYRESTLGPFGGAAVRRQFAGLGQLANYTGSPSGLLITPLVTGRILAVVNASLLAPDTSHMPTYTDLRIGSGTPPNTGDDYSVPGEPGVFIGKLVENINLSETFGANVGGFPFTLSGVFQGNVGTTYWVDISCGNCPTAGGAFLGVGGATLVEIA
jgi:hypothetical protein